MVLIPQYRNIPYRYHDILRIIHRYHNTFALPYHSKELYNTSVSAADYLYLSRYGGHRLHSNAGAHRDFLLITIQADVLHLQDGIAQRQHGVQARRLLAPNGVLPGHNDPVSYLKPYSILPHCGICYLLFIFTMILIFI